MQDGGRRRERRSRGGGASCTRLGTLVLLEVAVANVLNGLRMHGLGVAMGLDGGGIGVGGLGSLALGVCIRLLGVEGT